MLRLPRIALLLVALIAVVPVLAGCSNFDPDSLDVFGLSNKKPLPGKREALFPNGVPGVTQGIPPQYKEGYHAPAIADLPPGDSDATPAAGASRTSAAVPTKPVQQSNLVKPMRVHRTTVKHEARPKHHRVVKRKVKPKPKATATAAKPKGTTAPWPSTPPQAASRPTGTQAPWPSDSTASSAKPSQSEQAGWPSAKNNPNAKPKLAPWPSAPPSGSFSKE
ncbi:MAG: hypothetical protein WCA36_03690 [Pseudolabrys sp.]